jgi:hypothetical protein
VVGQLFPYDELTYEAHRYWPRHVALRTIAEHLPDPELAALAAQAAAADPESSRWPRIVVPVRERAQMLQAQTTDTARFDTVVALVLALSGQIAEMFERLTPEVAAAVFDAELGVVHHTVPEARATVRAMLTTTVWPDGVRRAAQLCATPRPWWLINLITEVCRQPVPETVLTSLVELENWDLDSATAEVVSCLVQDGVAGGGFDPDTVLQIARLV